MAPGRTSSGTLRGPPNQRNHSAWAQRLTNTRLQTACSLLARPSASAGQPGSLEMIVRSRRRSQSVVGAPVASARSAARYAR
jgi:hypothetical protein